MLALIEGRPLPRGQALADLLGLSQNAARALVRRLVKQGVLILADTVPANSIGVDCISYIEVDAVQAGNLEALDDYLRADPVIVVADRITGNFDYRLCSRHPDYRKANEWARGLASRADIARVLSQVCMSRREQLTYAAALLAADASLERNL